MNQLAQKELVATLYFLAGTSVSCAIAVVEPSPTKASAIINFLITLCIKTINITVGGR